jgi:hypothetical protein
VVAAVGATVGVITIITTIIIIVGPAWQALLRMPLRTATLVWSDAWSFVAMSERPARCSARAPLRMLTILTRSVRSIQSNSVRHWLMTSMMSQSNSEPHW